MAGNDQFGSFSRHLTKEGFCFLATERHRDLVLFNCNTKQIIPQSAIPILYRKWSPNKCDASGLILYLQTSLPLITGEIFKPNDLSLITQYGCVYQNTYRQFEVKCVSAEVSPLVHEFFDRLFADPEDRKICLQWLAHIFQKPEERPTWHLLLSSEVGTGKGFLFHRILSPLLIHTFLTREYGGLMGKHSLALKDNLLVMLDDPTCGSSSTMTRLKSVLTEPFVSVEPKHEAASMVRTYSRIILASNDQRPLPLDSDERRWYAPARLKHRINLTETQEFIARLEDWLSHPDSYSILYNWFSSLDLSDFNPKRTEQSPQLLRMIGKSKSPIDSFVSDFLSTKQAFKYSDLKEAIKTEGYELQSDNKLKEILTEHAFISGRYQNKTITLWHPESMDGNQAIAIYASNSF